MALTLSSVVFAIVALLQCSTRADILPQPYRQQTPSNYMPMAYQQRYSPYAGGSGYPSMQYQSIPYQSMVSSQYYPRSALDPAFQSYQDLNKLIQQQIDGTIQNDPNQMKNVEPNLGAPLSQSWISKLKGGMMFSATPDGGLKPVNNPQLGIYNGLIIGPSQQQGYNANLQTGAGTRTQWTRSVQPTGTDDRNVSSPLPKVQELDAVATQSAVTETSVTHTPELESLNESDKVVECRAIGQADSTIVGSPLQNSLPVGNWLANTYQNYYNKAALEQVFPTHQGHPGALGNMNPSNPMSPSRMMSHEGYGSYNQRAYSGANDSPKMASSLPSSGLPNDLNNVARTALDYVQKGLNYSQPSDWAHLANEFATRGISAGLYNPMNNNGLNYYQPSDWAHLANEWATRGMLAPAL